MSNIAQAFNKGKAFIGFLTGGDPDMEKSEAFIMEMIRAGADLVEIGVPFSDPIAEGPVIQEANLRALKAGATVEKLFALAERVRARSSVPLVFLTYLNPVFHYGYDRFFKQCRKSGLDGIIIPDLPFEEQGELRDITRSYGVDLISLIAPTSEERVSRIAGEAAGFIYLVSSLGVTGIRGAIDTNLAPIMERVRRVTDIPLAVGFGIHSPEQAAALSKTADGVIVGSAIVRLVAEHGGGAGPAIYDYVKAMKDALR
ncbi:MAG: tryptophan synthase subunit alpha [Spirochaetaceae bacterium]|jgi:tryptophan synthase alpha chain|nr:tryptophan synthase subunit alpha [Spirochaetaceae bacterium]